MEDNQTAWNTLMDKAARAGWSDWQSAYDPVYVNRHFFWQKSHLRILFRTPLLKYLFGEESTSTGTYNENLEEIFLPRYQVIAHKALDIMLAHEPVLAYLNSLETQFERDAK